MAHVITVELPNDTLTLSAGEGERLYDVIAGAGIQFDAPCGGRCFCGKCRAIMHDARGELIPGMGEEEARFFTEDERAQGWRLICAVDVHCDIMLKLGARGAQIMADSAQIGMESVAPAVTSRVIELSQPSLDDPRSDLDRLKAGADVRLSLDMMRRLPFALRECGFKPEVVALRDKALYIGAPGNGLYGVAVDVGTTTMVAYLMNLEDGSVVDVDSALNPQRVYGGDVISRSDFASQSEENGRKMQQLVVDKLDGMICGMARRKGIDAGRIFHIVLVGNTTMMHMLAGLTTRNISVSPFIPAVTEEITLPAREVGFTLANAMATVGPCVAGYVGADTVACVLDCGMDRSDELCLMVDIGTNGEIALGDKNGIICCSTAAGPALEGAHIKCGMGGVTGAISRVNLSDGVDIGVIGGGEAQGICGSGLVDAIAGMLDRGYIDEMGGMDEDEMGELAGEDAGRPALMLTDSVMITQRDVREVQLAKAAIAAGIQTLIAQRGCAIGDIGALYIAGGFGNYIDRERAARIGLLPRELLTRMKPVGNAAGAGAKRMLMSRAELDRASDIARNMEYLELSARTDFQDLFVDGMCFE
ncbi:MAG: ASKHA domain-containing protein [Candidatus Fimadaptatus sp.]|jgi:uncharacterized 2Fe-2S/4Fe-4S cluster protein (DUF4445 family)